MSLWLPRLGGRGFTARSGAPEHLTRGALERRAGLSERIPSGVGWIVTVSPDASRAGLLGPCGWVGPGSPVPVLTLAQQARTAVPGLPG